MYGPEAGGRRSDLGRVPPDSRPIFCGGASVARATWGSTDLGGTIGLLHAGAKLRVAFWPAADGGVAKGPGTVVLVQGRGEFIECYGEAIADLRRLGYAVVAFDLRGQGGSSRQSASGGHVGAFKDYSADIAAVVRLAADVGLPRPFTVLAHSMGGLAALRAQPLLVRDVDRMVLLAPMLQVAELPMPAGVIRAVSWMACLVGLARRPARKQTPVAESGKFAVNRVTSDPERYERIAALVEANRAYFDLESTPGEGSTFTVLLPLVAANAPGTEAEPEGRGTAPRRLEKSLRLLVAEDNEINQHLVGAMIERLGGTATIVGDGRSAIEEVERASKGEEPFDLVLMDLQMPGLDGIGATRILRERGFGESQVPIIALTANAYDEDVRACLDAGMQGHIAKPLTIEALSKALSRHANHRGAAECASASTGSERLPADHPLNRQYEDRKERLRDMIREIDPENVADRWSDLAGALHQLAGTAAVFGEPDLGKFAAGLEHSLLKAASDDERLKLILDNGNRLDEAA